MTDSSAESSETSVAPEASEPEEKQGEGLFRTGLLSTVLIILIVIILYGTFFLDNHLRHGIEWSATRLLGAEVNVESLDLSVWEGSLNLEKIQVTNLHKPEENAVQVGSCGVKLLWDGLLRGKFIIEELNMKKVQFGTPRSVPGRILSEEIVEEEADGPGAFSWLYELIAPTVKGAAKQRLAGTGLGRLTDLYSKKPLQDLTGSYSDRLDSFDQVEELGNSLSQAKEKWQKLQGKLPAGDSLTEFENEVKQIKEAEYESPADVKQGTKKLKKLKQKIEQTRNHLATGSSKLEELSNGLQEKLNKLDNSARGDREFLRSQLSARELNLSGLGDSAVGTLIRNRFGWISAASQSGESTEISAKKKAPVVKEPRLQGVDYRYPTKRAYPAFWLKKGELSFGGQQGKSGGGAIRDLSSYPPAVGRPTEIDIAADFPERNVRDLSLKVVLDRAAVPARDRLELRVGSYGLQDLEFIRSDVLSWGLEQGRARIEFVGDRTETLTVNLQAKLTELKHSVEANSPELEEIFKAAVASIEKTTVTAHGEQSEGRMNWSVETDLGEQLAAGLKEQLGQRLAAKRDRLVEAFNKKLAARRESIRSRIQKIEAKYKKVKQLKNRVDKLKGKANISLKDRLKESLGKRLKGSDLFD